MAKTGIQLVAVAGVGSVATIAVQVYLDSVRNAAADQRTLLENAETERREATAAAEAKQRQKDQEEQRRVDFLRDERRRRDDLYRSILQTTVKSYNYVKSVRRRLRAASGFRWDPGPDEGDVSLNTIAAETLQITSFKNSLISNSNSKN